MLYNYDFEIASLVTGAFLLVVYAIRRTLRTKANNLLLALLCVCFFGSLIDIVSCFCISYPEKYPDAFNAFTCLAYLFLYNFMGILFLAYIDSKTKIVSLHKPIKIYLFAITVFELIVIGTSQQTHLVAFFDENNVYQHGPLMPLLYVLAALHLFVSALMFINKRRRFNKYQVAAIVSFIVVVFGGVLVQLIFPRLLVGQFGNTLVLFFIYVSLENPVYQTYSATTCFNRTGFKEVLKLKIRMHESFSIYAFKIKDYDTFRESLSLKEQARLSSVIAEYISGLYKYNAFCITDDKFAIIMKDCKEVEDIQNSLDTFFSKDIELIDTSVSVSFGNIIIHEIEDDTKPEIIEDSIVYALDKNLSQDKLFLFSEVTDKLKRRKAISRAVNNAIENDLFEVHYQPIRCPQKEKFISCEALIRLHDEVLGNISPEEFIPIAEGEGLIVKIGAIVFEKVCRFIHESRIIDTLGVKYIEINMSPIQLVETDIVSKYCEIMERYEINPSWINLEITETANQDNEKVMMKNIEAFHRLGMSFSLDDYGSGFASADYLFRFPVEIVKIDKFILWQAMEDANAGVVLIGTLGLLKSLGKEIVVEGVETEEMVDLLLDNGVDFFQGFYYSKPLNGNDYVEFLKKNNK